MSFAPIESLSSLSPSFHRRFVVLEECGVGGSAFCLKVQRRLDGLICVAKVVAKERVSVQGMVRTKMWGEVPEGFRLEEDGSLVVPSEAYVLRRVRHGNVVAFYDLFACDRFFYIIMEYHGNAWRYDTQQQPAYLPSPPITPPSNFSDFPRAPSAEDPHSSVGVSTPPSPPTAPMMRRSSSDLFECVEKHRHFSEAIARFIFQQIVHAVYDLARIGILHRDLKDENCVISADCRVKLVDFGSCIMFDPTKPFPVQHEQRFYGTSSYAAPEVFAGTSYSMLSAEVWSLGVLLSSILTGEHPFLSPIDAAAGQRLPSKVALSPGARHLMDRCLTVEVGRRATLEEVRNHPWLFGKPSV